MTIVKVRINNPTEMPRNTLACGSVTFSNNSRQYHRNRMSRFTRRRTGKYVMQRDSPSAVVLWNSSNVSLSPIFFFGAGVVDIVFQELLEFVETSKHLLH